MPVKIETTTEDVIRKIPFLSIYGKGAIPHNLVIDEIKKQLANAGLSIVREIYKATGTGDVVQGLYVIDYGDVPGLTLMFGWTNSYKHTNFKCTMGAVVDVCNNSVLGNDQTKKKYRKMILADIEESIRQEIDGAKDTYVSLVKDKEMLQNIFLSPIEKGNIIGQLFITLDIITLSQLAVIKREIDTPSFVYSSNKDSAWDLYNHITNSLKDAHPVSYLDDHQKVHKFFVDTYGGLVLEAKTPPPVIQTNHETIDVSKYEHMNGVVFL